MTKKQGKNITHIKDLQPDSENARKHNPRNVGMISEALQEVGAARSIVIDEDGRVLAGNATIDAAGQAGIEKVRVIDADGDEIIAVRRSNLTKRQKTRLALYDNQTADLAEWDDDVLKKMFEKDAKIFDKIFRENELQEFGIEQEPVDAEPQIDKAEELNKIWQVKTGDLWKIGEHRLLCGDSTKREDVERVMGGEKAICVFTDPPYGVSIGKKNVMLNTFQPSGRCLDDLDMDDMSPKELGDMLLKVFTLWKEYMADNCAVFVCSPQGGGLGMMMMMMMMNAGLEVMHIINWVKNSPTFSMGRLDYDYQHEPILFTWTKTHKRKKEGQFHTSLWEVDKPRANKEHPTMKPVELPINAILNHTDEGDLVADMFGGSGTTMIASEQTKRNCRMVEISPAYCAVVLQRMQDAFPEIAIERIEDGTA